MSGLILVVVLGLFVVLGAGAMYFVNLKMKSMQQLAAEIAVQNKRKNDTDRGEKLFGEVSTVLATHNDCLKQIDARTEAETQPINVAEIRITSRETSETLDSCSTQINELLSEYGDVYKAERSRIETYASNAAQMDQMLGDRTAVDDMNQSVLLNLVQEMMEENDQLRTKVATCREQMSHLVAQSAMAEREARIDPSTQLPNRRAWEEELVLLQDDHSSAMIMVDVDSFKLINDGYGHAAGDAMLTLVGTVLKKTPGVKAFRIAGDEFTFLVRGESDDRVQKIAEQIRGRVAASTLRYKGDALSVSISLGLARRQPGETAQQTFIRSDQALYCAKTSGGNQVVCFWTAPQARGASAAVPPVSVEPDPAALEIG